tara:strand:+ start:554 stop:1102 length:549 start_codon:yes stop_codon:yes gene_type:complete
VKLIFSPIISIILVLITIIAIQSPDTYIDTTNKQKADFTFENVTISMLKNGKKIWTIKADSSFIFKHTNSFYLNNIDGLIFGETDGTLSFQSPAGAFSTKTQILHMVQTKSKLNIEEQSYFIISDEIEINSSTRFVNAYGNILINSDTIIVRGDQMTANLNENKLYLNNDIKGSFISTYTIN